METINHYFYVLLCGDGSYYGGYTTDLKRRVRLHDEGKGAKYTRGRGPVKLIFSRAYSTKTEAMQAEYRFKQLPRLKKDAFLARERGEGIAATEKF
ncbi:GIY-YIG nuclease family protein [Neobacillus notoginsengisoli]|uniref:GIY-YIG nuclease family protein n=1 Tax=Neobacillus notoginsengisoli TaxID=1578198 RepID=A0A417YG82_9BACI|nr:GIY-YIG nuclease family protein [Neobacillus notoginsengisoli]RHW31789.1 GIY-YIG nuclease family protein [Neobacillus notoginsengisoli]